MVSCDSDLASQINVGMDELNVRAIGYCAMLEKDAMHQGTEADVSANVLDINRTKESLRYCNTHEQS